jgi:hypothetical protein
LRRRKPMALTPALERSMTMNLFAAALAIESKTEPLQGLTDTDSLYILIASLVLAFIAFVILMRVRF